jgi:anti-anti-sigma regulatory factor
VPVIDATGIANLRSTLSRLHADGLVVVLAGVRPRVAAVLERAGLQAQEGRTLFARDARAALEAARAFAPAADGAATAGSR